MGRFGFSFKSMIFFGLCLVHVYGEPLQDKQALLDFLQNTSISRSLNWDPNKPLCTNWTGVTCNDGQTRVVALRLPGVGIRGFLPPDTLSRLSALQTLSLRNNEISSVFPSDFSKLGNLTSLYLQYNKFSGTLPLNFSVWPNLVVLDLSNNNFNGTIPISFSNLTHITTLDLSSNSLSGQIPDLGIPSLRYLNLSYNHLSGNVPNSLLRFPSSSFSGNDVSLRAVSIPLKPSSLPSDSPSHKAKKISQTAVLGIIIGGAAVLFVMIALCMLFLFSKKKNKDRNSDSEAQTKEKFSTFKRFPTESREEKSARIMFFEGSKLAFNLEDLLRASAEVLGKGTFGTTYKATLEDTNIVVVKRLKEVNVGRREFEQQMEIVGNIKHENVAALRAYYFSKDEKLMVYDYFRHGSLSTMLHGKREKRPPLDWETRLTIAIGAARGLAHIHSQNGGRLVHGNIKSSNIFLNTQNYGCVSDLGLATIVTPVAPPIQRTVGYRAPEVTDPRKATQDSDVYSFGVLLLELLTGKMPLGEGMHLVKWVYSVVREEWTAEVFDVALLRYPNIEEEMVAMLQLSMSCTERVSEKRPKMWEVVKMVEDIRQGHSGTRPSSEASTPTPTGLSHTVEVGSSSNSKSPIFSQHNKIACPSS
ncbi:probable inactive receptor kinase At4g23740 [Amaranthus tricolor]|uniref:probable inactive receptor kinase At4g23740 n=1 Tax=Amaranthus tricolor TaxID=29722 RepID=UPI002585BA5E|nr:probable inactive receptor kinase At4g23740 [Amaranthus tricolor]XP_057525684.1 probable inactive receptor kinase At4g23740 [Amaranthus tricolor]XP_057525685.1 probable inactive receptor kinase At4g23740 [Amaranthus tricolor]